MIITRGLGNPSAIVTRGLGAGIGIVVFRAVLEAVSTVTTVTGRHSEASSTSDVASQVATILNLDATATAVAEIVATLSGTEQSELVQAVTDHLTGTTGATERLEAVLDRYGLGGLVNVTDRNDASTGWEHS